ncbi:uncharacterized protein N7479_003341 [Penicillium vulpinum]|uniref:uncharacterized protein n=1 Tax=Penicillium vulpinum TaxID=29845 RepID=UPI0025481468|nr:uncharacterized protein N7479_003341 [Penicillium vulpinum]KAJ5963465.1 hypothetical protein N7479_003341 [Penicillium vulpinum]
MSFDDINRPDVEFTTRHVDRNMAIATASIENSGTRRQIQCFKKPVFHSTKGFLDRERPPAAGLIVSEMPSTA